MVVVRRLHIRIDRDSHKIEPWRPLDNLNPEVRGWVNSVANLLGDEFDVCLWILEADWLVCGIIDAEEDGSADGIGKGRDGLEPALWPRSLHGYLELAICNLCKKLVHRIPNLRQAFSQLR